MATIHALTRTLLLVAVVLFASRTVLLISGLIDGGFSLARMNMLTILDIVFAATLVFAIVSALWAWARKRGGS
jgi:hypothetical protein